MLFACISYRDTGIQGFALAEQFLQLNGDNDNAPVLTLAPSMQTVAEDSSITVFNTVAITDNDDVVPCDPQCFNELRFTVANPPVLAANALVIDPVGAVSSVWSADFASCPPAQIFPREAASVSKHTIVLIS